MTDDKGGKNSGLIFETIQGMFANHNVDLGKAGNKAQKGRSLPRKDMELAVAVLLVDLASCDQNFDQGEYQVVSNGLRRLFGTTKDQVTALVNQAQVQLSGLRGTNRFSDLLRENFSDEEKAAVLDVVEELIAADGTEDGFETYLRQRISEALGVGVPPTKK